MKVFLVFCAVFLVSSLAFAQSTEAGIDPASILSLIQHHSWWALAAFAIGFVVRVLKDDSFVLPKWATVPSAYRPALALGLGVIAGVLSKLAGGTDWKTAMLWGLSAATAAIFSHTLIVEAARKGRDLGTPKDSTEPTSRVDQRGLARIETIAFVATFAIMGLTAGCAWLKANDGKIIQTTDVACETVDLLDNALAPLCLSAEAIEKALAVLLTAPAGSDVELRFQHTDGSIAVVHVPADRVEQLAKQLVSARRAAARRQ